MRRLEIGWKLLQPLNGDKYLLQLAYLFQVSRRIQSTSFLSSFYVQRTWTSLPEQLLETSLLFYASSH